MDASALLNEIRQQLGLQVDFTQILLGFALLMARVLPVLILTPFLGGETVPSEVKIGLGVMLGLVLAPLVMSQVRNVPVTAIFFVALLLKELFIGLAIAMVVSMVFDSANMAGGLIDTISGTNQAQLMVPQMGSQVSLFANLKLQLVTVLFLTLGGHHVVIQTIAESLNTLPLDQYPRFSNGSWAFYDTLLRVSGDVFRVALALSSPVLLAGFLTDLALGMINRVAPQVQVFFVAMQIKPGVTVLIMFTAMHLILARVVGEYGVMFQWLKQMLRLLG
jgi:flagellar biosynthesis protein FliR